MEQTQNERVPNESSPIDPSILKYALKTINIKFDF